MRVIYLALGLLMLLGASIQNRLPALSGQSLQTNNAIIERSAATIPPTQPITIAQSALEIVASNTISGDGGNAWGGHQTRIVRTLDGVFTAYMVQGSDYLSKEWRLAWRQEDGTWPVVAQGIGGREPVNLLASPDGTLHVIGWPGGIGTIWSGKPISHSLQMTASLIPGVAEGNWPYGSAGIDAAGNLCVVNTNEIYQNDQTVGGAYDWSCFVAAANKWVPKRSEFDYRYAYTYVFPRSNGELSLVATRDVRWEQLGYVKPTDAFDYVFNAFRYWHTADLQGEPLQVLNFAEEPPTAAYPDVFLDAQMDAYLDTQERMHILYVRRGASTSGAQQIWRRMVAANGATLLDEKLPDEVGYQLRVFEDTQGRIYLLSGSAAKIFPLSQDGMKIGVPTAIDLGGYTLAYTGPFLAAPRTGTPISNKVDVVFPSEDEQQWVYFQLDLSGGGELPTQSGNLLQNGNFDEAVAPWQGGIASANGAGLVVRNGQLCLDIPDSATGAADAQMGQYGVALYEGQTYQVDFDMVANASTTVRFMIGESEPPWSHYFETEVNLSTTLKHFSFNFVMQHPGDLNSLLTFHLGGQAATTICLDNVSVTNAQTVTQAVYLPLVGR